MDVTGRWHDAPVMETTAVHFANAAKVLANAARLLDLEPPGFRSPPRVEGADRTLRGGGSTAVVSVRLRGRPWPAVLADLVEGVVVANHLSGSAAGRARAELWSSLDEAGLVGGASETDVAAPHDGRRAPLGRAPTRRPAAGAAPVGGIVAAGHDTSRAA
jgi:hypothetical protein